MSRLAELAQAIRDLPEIDSKRDQLKIVKDARQQAQTVLDGIQRARRRAPYVERLAEQPGALTKAVEHAEEQMWTEAQKLIRLISRENFGAERSISAALEGLRRPLPKVNSAIDSAWTVLTNRVGGFQEVAEIASRLNLGNAGKLQQAIRAYSLATQSPPESSGDLQRVASATESLESSVAASGLSGKVKALLVNAARQEGDARLLLEKEVADFLAQHPTLWSRLKVKLG